LLRPLAPAEGGFAPATVRGLTTTAGIAGGGDGSPRQPGMCVSRMLVFQRVEVTASLDDPGPALARARREAEAGDTSWAQWVDEYERGEALILRLDLRLHVSDGQPHVIEVSNQGVFVERSIHVPQVEQQIAEMTSKDYAEVAARLRRHGHRIDTFDLGEMYVHVELAPALRARLREASAQRPAPAGRPAGETALSRPIEPDQR